MFQNFLDHLPDLRCHLALRLLCAARGAPAGATIGTRAEAGDVLGVVCAMRVCVCAVAGRK